MRVKEKMIREKRNMWRKRRKMWKIKSKRVFFLTGWFQIIMWPSIEKL